MVLLAIQQDPVSYTHLDVYKRQCQTLTKVYWDLIMEFTEGDMSMLPKLIEFGKLNNTTNEWEEKQKKLNAYLEPALEIYFSRLGINPFEGVET